MDIMIAVLKVQLEANPYQNVTQMNMPVLRSVQNERFTFEIDKENALVGCQCTQ